MFVNWEAILIKCIFLFPYCNPICYDNSAIHGEMQRKAMVAMSVCWASEQQGQGCADLLLFECSFNAGVSVVCLQSLLQGLY